MFGISKGQSVDGSAIVVMKPSLWDPSDLSLEEFGQFAITYQAAFIQSQVHGIHAIVDASGITWSQLYAIGPVRGKFIGEFSSTILPVRIRKVHLIHTSRLARFGLRMILPFMNKKVRERVFFHDGNLSDVFRCCPPSAIPVEYGGQATEQCSIGDHLVMIENGRRILEDVWQQVRDDHKSTIEK
ncbi:alpha-tocopherol transfer protein-like [Brevipalpus obovatus]|uniref:alpha-tocopherol transfer protein-like n=1 Tax=Brevipalpus obovatus TaxID=246614 RepID=UPI003D9E7DE9